jgi:hypothetical protein
MFLNSPTLKFVMGELDEYFIFVLIKLNIYKYTKNKLNNQNIFIGNEGKENNRKDYQSPQD